LSKLLSPGQSLGKYQIINIVGAGNIGIVYKAYDATIDRIVAIKTLHHDLLVSERGEEFRKRFIQEATAAARCQHPNVLTIFEFAEDLGIPFISMEYVEGDELKTFLKDSIAFSVQNIVLIVQQLLSGLQYTHSKDVVHRDIKPANIILLNKNEIKITDFGIAEILVNANRRKKIEKKEKQKKEKQKKDTCLIGTPNYMSPEQLLGMQVDQRSDLYSVALILFELLSQSKQKQQELPRGFHLRDKKNITLGYLKKYIQTEFIDLVCTTLQPSITNRYQSATQFSNALMTCYKQYLENRTRSKPIGINASIYHPNNHRSHPLNSLARGHIPINQLLDIYFKNKAKKSNLIVKKSEKPHSHLSEKPLDAIWPNKFIQQLDRNLAQYIGPFSRFIVQRYSQQHYNLNTFIDTLSQRIPDEPDRRNFVKSATQLYNDTGDNSGETISDNPGDNDNLNHNTNEVTDKSTRFSSETLQQAETNLTHFLGPIARTLVTQTASSAVNHNDLYRKLANYIPKDDEKTAFVNSMPM